MNELRHSQRGWPQPEPLCQTYVVDCRTNLTAKRREPPTSADRNDDRTLRRQKYRLSSRKASRKPQKTIDISYHHCLSFARHAGCGCGGGPAGRLLASALLHRPHSTPPLATAAAPRAINAHRWAEWTKVGCSEAAILLTEPRTKKMDEWKLQYRTHVFCCYCA